MLRVRASSSSSVTARLDAHAVAAVAVEHADAMPLCSTADHFTADSPQWRPLQYVPQEQTAHWKRPCGFCHVRTTCGAWHCRHCLTAWCHRCLLANPLQHLSSSERAALRHPKSPGTTRQHRLDHTGAWPVHGRESETASMGEWPACDERGRMFAWFLWTGTNPLPAYLQLCIDSFAHVAVEHFHVRLVRPEDVAELLEGGGRGAVTSGGLHPAYEYLSLVHRSDYLRCELMHAYGGLYCDCDTICCSSLAEAVEALRTSASVLPGLGLLHEAGMNAGLFRRRSSLTHRWRHALRHRLDVRLGVLQEYRQAFPHSPTEDGLEWNELLRDLVVPLVQALQALHQDGHAGGCSLDCGGALRAHLWLPTRQQGFDPLACREGGDADGADSVAGVDGGGAGADGAAMMPSADVIILTNNAYDGKIKALSRDAFLRSGCVLAERLRQVNGLSV